jgi:hypothetical protein
MKFKHLLSTNELAPPLDYAEAQVLARQIGEWAGLDIYQRSVVISHHALFCLGRGENGKQLLILSGQAPVANEFEGQAQPVADDLALKLCPTSAANVQALHRALPFTKPRLLGLATSAGCGDRLGLATPGHIQAARGKGIALILAQQSMRENARTHRTPQEVIDDATWGVFQEGWRQGYGADADHLKTPHDIDICVAAGYTFFTIDPGDHVNNEAHTASHGRLGEIVAALPWDALETTSADLNQRYLDQTFEIADDFVISFSEETLARAAGKYGQAIAHTAMMYRHLAGLTENFELEMSVDETETVTSIEEHFFIVSELKRLGVQWVSLAPRYVGRFEKGVDYIGDLDEFEASFARHAAIARHAGPYKLSLHSGSDKFSIYPIAARQTEGLVHLKTAGTSYLEALRAIAGVNPTLFRDILTLSIERYPVERATYHVSADLDRVPAPDSLSDSELAGLIDQFDARQVLHVCYGTALDNFGPELIETLKENEDLYDAVLKAHFDRHLQPFVQT